MSLDGLSFSNLGIFRPTAPSEVAHQAEQASQAEAEKLVKEVEKLEKNQLDPDEEKDNQQEANLKKRKQQEHLDEEEIEGSSNLNQYSVKFNNQTNLVELVDKETGKVIETIQPEDLINLMAKSKDPSGILVDREV